MSTEPRINGQVSTELLTGRLHPDLLRRAVVERVRPEVDGGRFPIKRAAGESVVVRADVFADGHDLVAAAVLCRRPDDPWREVPMEALGNDRWQAAFDVTELGRYQYTVEGWVDRFGSWRAELSKKVGAGQDVGTELLEGATLIRALLRDADDTPDVRDLRARASFIGDTAIPPGERIAAALAERLRSGLARRGHRDPRTRYDRVLEVLVERDLARFGAWYEMFPRSAGPDPSRSATFAEAAGLLPYVASMGFDVLYLPPIHPIGRSFRKGRNNTLEAGPDDVGSPWAIGGPEGGHTAVEPGLGSLADFDRFVEQARRHGLEVALDIAYQASPDHPYVGEHPEWFRHRPDGSIKYAENPPKKYQDIYPFNFESDAWEPLWLELKQVIEFWVARGVKIFRVDNPHTKPFRFWEWALADVKRQHPDTIFLSEAFTRPKVMRYLAKAGFSQSYTYFTWRNTSDELRDYFTELTQTPVREYLRPNLFANTPDILHAYLQRGGRPAFQVRLVLAATLGASYGIYSGFELAENVAVREGSEEYLDSEKYQIRIRDFSRADSLAELVARVNAVRRDHPALHRDWGLRFHDTDNPQLLAYSKRSVDGTDLLLMVVNVDPVNMQHGHVRLPLEAWGLPPDGPVDALDLLSAERYVWRAEWNYVRLDPPVRVAHILQIRLAAPLPSEPDRDDD
ncbi:MAG TPA: alpha-1,4-glucan--maltose-1-phosphate maltosyltransferase [Vicinamibacterales bacterium]|nr:alpha-1,4-glucan--maltose-1-phosphate maltosyltransferase [Vicinamibacterales bacterium]